MNSPGPGRTDPGRAIALVSQALVVAGLALALASLARHRLVEPADLTALCDAAPWETLTCTLRTPLLKTLSASNRSCALSPPARRRMALTSASSRSTHTPRFKPRGSTTVP